SEILNQGAELSVSATPVSTRDWRLSIGANIAWNRNKLLKYNPPSQSLFNDNYVGYPIGSVISGHVVGIDRELGIYTYEVRPDAEMNTAADRGKAMNYAFYLGTSNAPVNGGYSISLGYKKATLSLGGSYSIGAKVLNNIKPPQDYAVLEYDRTANETPPTQDNDLYVYHFNTTADHINRWTTANPRTDAYPRIIDAFGDYLGLGNYMVNLSNITRASMLENISYFKLGTVMLTYVLDNEWLRRAHIESVTLSGSMSNIFTITNYKGIDPETPGAVYPQPRTYSFGISVSL
ncbi:MAG: TonB-dependent receptor, partial [Muribaculaceae bacterium]|nr:TonB-dependent receptor [Muribaculaceae bacterium]